MDENCSLLPTQISLQNWQGNLGHTAQEGIYGVFVYKYFPLVGGPGVVIALCI